MSLTTDIDIKDLVRTIPDYPKPGIMFRDITTLLGHANGFRSCVEQLVQPFSNRRVQSVVGIEARGFIFGPALAYRLNAGFVPVREPKKLPAEVLQWKYDLEYGQDTLEIHKDAIQPGQRILICDDLLATGGTAKAAAAMVESLGGKICGMGFVVELDGLKGREKLKNYDIFSLLHYEM